MIRKSFCASALFAENIPWIVSRETNNRCFICISEYLDMKKSINAKCLCHNGLYIPRLNRYVSCESLSVIIRYSALAGIFSSNFTRKSHHLATDGIFSLSLGECTSVIVGPIEIMSSCGYFSRNSPHSNPA